MNVLERDSTFLKEHNLIDYSMLIIQMKKHSASSNGEILENEASVHTQIGSNYIKGKEYDYELCIIDFLMVYSGKKYLENRFKAAWNKVSSEDVSAIDPISYQNRFMQYL